MSDYTFPQVNCDKYHIIIRAESLEKAQERYDIIIGKKTDN